MAVLFIKKILDSLKYIFYRSDSIENERPTDQGIPLLQTIHLKKYILMIEYNTSVTSV